MKCTSPCDLPGCDVDQDEVQLMEQVPKLGGEAQANSLSQETASHLIIFG